MEFERLLKYASAFTKAAGHPRADYMREYMKNRYRNKRQEIIDRLGGKCSRCGSKDGTFHLDHIDKKKKTMRAADMHSVNDKKFEEEIKNLQILCKNCHHIKSREAWDYSDRTPRSTHGSYWHYRRYNCRCPACVKAYKKKQKEWHEKKADVFYDLFV